MSRILVVFASHFGQTRSIAERIASHLRRLDHVVDVVEVAAGPSRLPPPKDYNAIVIGSRVEAGRHASGIRNYITKHLDSLRAVPTAFFSVSMAAARTSAGVDPDGYMGAMFTDLAWKPTHAVAFAGGLPYRKYGWILRFIMKRISRRAGHPTDTSRNHELTDWARVEHFADRVAAISSTEQLAHQTYREL